MMCIILTSLTYLNAEEKNSDVSYEKVYMANTGNEYLTDILEPNMSLMTATFI